MIGGLDRRVPLSRLDSLTRFALLVHVLRTRTLAMDVCLDGATVGDVLYWCSGCEPSHPPPLDSAPLQSERVGLRAPQPDDVSIVYRALNDARDLWRAPNRGKHVKLDSIFQMLTNTYDEVKIGYERHTGRPTTLLTLNYTSYGARVGKLGVLSLRNGTDPLSAASTECLACFLSHCFWVHGLRKITHSVLDRDYWQVSPGEGVIFAREGSLAGYIVHGGQPRDLYLIAIWRETWMALEIELRLALLNWTTS